MEPTLKQNAVTIVPIRQGDNAVVKEIIIQVLKEHGCFGPGFASQDKELHNLYESYQQYRTAYYVVLVDEKVVGGAGIAPLEGGNDDVCELRKMYLLSNSRGLGVGSKLMQQCLDFARDMGYKKCYLETASQMERAIKLYKKFGFVKQPTRLGETQHFGCDAFFLANLA